MTPTTVLLVDDDRDSLTIYTLILEHHGYRVLIAHSAEEGLRMAREARPDLVIAELFLRPVDGSPLPERLKLDADTAHLRVVGISTQQAPERRAGIEACDSYLPKPCVPSRMLAEVQRFLTLPQISA